MRAPQPRLGLWQVTSSCAYIALMSTAFRDGLSAPARRLVSENVHESIFNSNCGLLHTHNVLHRTDGPSILCWIPFILSIRHRLLPCRPRSSIHIKTSHPQHNSNNNTNLLSFRRLSYTTHTHAITLLRSLLEPSMGEVVLLDAMKTRHA